MFVSLGCLLFLACVHLHYWVAIFFSSMSGVCEVKRKPREHVIMSFLGSQCPACSSFFPLFLRVFLCLLYIIKLGIFIVFHKVREIRKRRTFPHDGFSEDNFEEMIWDGFMENQKAYKLPDNGLPVNPKSVQVSNHPYSFSLRMIKNRFRARD